MSERITRRTFLRAACAAPLLLARGARAGQGADDARGRLARLEADFGGRLGVCVLDTATGGTLGYRADVRFPLCSTFKAYLASAVLARSRRDPGLLARRIAYGGADLQSYSPVTSRHIGGMTVADLCAAAIQYSDNTAANLLLKLVGGPAAVTAFARSIGDRAFRLDRWEPDLNTAIPGDARDTTTPGAMAHGLRTLALGDGLREDERARLIAWLRGTTTGAGRIRAGIPADWAEGDKTGTGDYGTANDVALLWPPGRRPIVLAVYTTQAAKDAKPCSDVVASAARIMTDWSQ